MLAQVAQLDTLHQRSRGGRNEHLPAVTCRRDASGAMHILPHVTLFGQKRRARVHANPHLDRAGRKGVAHRSSR